MLIKILMTNKASDHLNCADTSCPRCSPQTASPCCDLCNPRAFDHLFSYFEPPPPPTKSSKSSLKKYDRGEPEMRLAKALNEWRRKATIEKYGEAVLRDVGSSLILPTELLERLVDCAHYGKITNLDQLHKEVNWVVDDVFGLEVIGIITSMCPPPQPRQRKRPRPREEGPSRTLNVRRPLGTNRRVLNTQPAPSVSTFPP